MTETRKMDLSLFCRRLAVCVAVWIACAHAQNDEFLYDTFPVNFKWATATSSYQIEGAWNVDGKGENIWDKFTHEGGNVANNDTGDVACDSYNKFQEDVRLLKDLKVHYYRFSISWSRILPTGMLAGGVNQAGLDYYEGLVDALQAEGIEPMVTLYHWDLPQPLQDIDGWQNEDLIQHFKDYADTCFKGLGHKVKLWLTFNEPWVVTWLGYGNGVFAPGVKDPAQGAYKAGHTIIKAHAEAYHLYNDTYRAIQDGKISITIDSGWAEPKDPNNSSDVEAAEREMQFKLGWYANPIYNGDYPEIMRTMVQEKSLAQGYTESRLPAFTEEQIQRIKGTHDFFGLNHYTTGLITHQEADISCESWECDKDIASSHDPNWPSSGSSWLWSVPWGLRKLLVWIKDNYDNVPVFVTENGVSDRNSSLTDEFRSNFYRGYINEMLKAHKINGCAVLGYTAWSLMDNFEWGAGYDEKFGLHHVDFSDPERPRTPKQSARDYTTIIENNGFPLSTTTPPPTDAASSLASPMAAILVAMAILSVTF